MDEVLKLYHQRAVEIWEQFCKLHHDLYELTCDEYQTLLSGEIDKLEELIPRKEALMSEISNWESARADLIAKINASGTATAPVKNVTDLLTLLQPIEDSLTIPALKNLNALLIDVITRIQEQNKRNQLFLNKAMASIRDLRDGFSGKKKFTTYGADGQTRAAGR